MANEVTITLSVVEDANAKGGWKIVAEPNDYHGQDDHGRKRARARSYTKVSWAGDETLKDCKWVVGVKSTRVNPFRGRYLATGTGSGSDELKLTGGLKDGDEYPYFVFVSRQADDGPALFADPIIVIDNGPGGGGFTEDRLEESAREFLRRFRDGVEKVRDEVAEELEELVEDLANLTKKR